MKVKLKFMGLGLGDELQANVKIWCCDTNYNFMGSTYNGKLSLELDCGYLYHLYATSCGEVINLSFYVDKHKTYLFTFSRSIQKKITFHLMDSYYPNLPIEKGELLIWQK